MDETTGTGPVVHYRSSNRKWDKYRVWHGNDLDDLQSKHTAKTLWGAKRIARKLEKVYKCVEVRDNDRWTSVVFPPAG